MQHKTSQVLYEYWNKVRAGRPAPHRFEIEPARIGAILPETFILERIDHQTYRFRLAGTRLCEQFGREFRGTNFLDFWSDGDRITLERQFSCMCEETAVSILTFAASNGKDDLATFETVVFPLLHTSTQVSRYLGAMSVADSPPWLGHDRITSQSLLTHELLWPDGRQSLSLADRLKQAPLARDGARLVRQDRRFFRVYDGGLSKPRVKR